QYQALRRYLTLSHPHLQRGGRLSSRRASGPGGPPRHHRHSPPDAERRRAWWCIWLDRPCLSTPGYQEVALASPPDCRLDLPTLSKTGHLASGPQWKEIQGDAAG